MSADHGPESSGAGAPSESAVEQRRRLIRRIAAAAMAPAVIATIVGHSRPARARP
jgi:hypothetical protein